MFAGGVRPQEVTESAMKSYLVLATVLAVCSWVASDSNYYKISTEIGRRCKCRVGATDLDIEVIATRQPVKTEVQKKLLHCGYQKVKIVCGNYLADIEYLISAYVMINDGDASTFNNITAKIQECYNAGKEFDGVDGIKIANTMHSCFNKQWHQDNEKVQSPRVQPVLPIDKSSIYKNVAGMFMVKI